MLTKLRSQGTPPEPATSTVAPEWRPPTLGVDHVRHNVRLPWHEDTLVAQIERDALDDSVALSSALRKWVVLGGKANSEALRDWATRELHGYQGGDELPEYRVINAPLVIDGIAGNYKITRQP